MKLLLTNFAKMCNDSGGLAKVTCCFANEMEKRGFDVSLIYCDEKKGEFFFPISDKVKLYNLKETRFGKIVKYPSYLKLLRELVRPISKRHARELNSWFNEKYLKDNLEYYIEAIKPDVIVASQPASSKMLLFDLKVEVPIITMSHGDPEDYFYTYPKAEIPALEKSAVCQVLVPCFEEHIKKYLPKANTITIGNVVPQYQRSAKLNEEKELFKIIFVGRLAKGHKRPHIIIDAFAKIAEKYPNWILELWGAKDRKAYYAELENKIKKNNLQERVFLKGITKNIPEVLEKADIFAFPSAVEGFPLAMTEAMSMGIPVIGCRKCVAVNELLLDGKTGILCNEGVDEFAQALEKLIKNKDLRISMGKAAKENMKQYAPDVIWDKWHDLIRTV